MTRPLYDRAYTLTIGRGVEGVKITELHVEFNVVHQKGAPNEGTFIVYNFAESTRRRLSEDGEDGLPLRILFEAGYQGDPSQLFLGRVRRNGVISRRQGADWVTEITADDGGPEIRRADVDISFPKGTPVTDVMSQLVDATGLNPGDLIERVQQKGFAGTLSEFKRGFTASGNADKVLKDLGRALGVTVSVQDGAYTAFESQSGSVDVGIVVSPDTGLIESPELGDKGVLRVRTLLQPSLRPGHQIKLESEQFNGRYRVEKATHNGTFRGPNWFTDLDLKAL